jgi:hypothetical protein
MTDLYDPTPTLREGLTSGTMSGTESRTEQQAVAYRPTFQASTRLVLRAISSSTARPASATEIASAVHGYQPMGISPRSSRTLGRHTGPRNRSGRATMTMMSGVTAFAQRQSPVDVRHYPDVRTYSTRVGNLSHPLLASRHGLRVLATQDNSETLGFTSTLTQEQVMAYRIEVMRPGRRSRKTKTENEEAKAALVS